MKQTELFTKTRKEAPKDEVSKNAELLIRAGYIHKELAGVYSYLPLGLRVLNNIVEVIRQEMNNLGGKEVFLSAIQDKNVWEKTNRWTDNEVPIWFKTKLQSGGEVGLGFTHEEPLTNLMRDYIQSFRDLPAYVYQFQTKFRNETRAKSGIMRGREFLMKDLYSFSKDEKEHSVFYEKTKEAYLRIFKNVGLGDRTHLTFASGGSFSKYSHEFQTITEAGEDIIHVCEKCGTAVNDEIFAEQKVCPECGNTKLSPNKAVEVGNIFNLGTRFSEAFGLQYLDEKGSKIPVWMGSYGIGPGRLMGTIVEVLSDEKGIAWPKGVAPFSVHLIEINPKKNGDVSKEAENVYHELRKAGVEVLWDDREATAGTKFADSDLIGIPTRLVVSEKTIAEKVVEVKGRGDSEAKKVGRIKILESL